HFSVVECGSVAGAELPIFVDMDVLRDMEAHARENTRVELGGVMLGQQHLDENGQPFVTITDSLRAKHYEATKGSFKFTHETWSQITRDRNEYRDDLEMVGWYHTHPGWGVFLSGMDLFICNNFFNRPLDVALVIDPCAGDRGWFQWSDGSTKQTAGFFLMTNRHRQKELNYFADMFGREGQTLIDPRFRQNSFSEYNHNEGGDSMVNVIDNRRPIFELVIVSMLFLQFVVVAIFGWRMLDTESKSLDDERSNRLAAVESRLDAEELVKRNSIREQAYSEILNRIVESKTGQPGVVEQYAKIATENRMLQENLEGQIARNELANSANQELGLKLRHESIKAESLRQELVEARTSIETLEEKNDNLQQLAGAGDAEIVESKAVLPAWAPYFGGGVLLVLIGLVGGHYMSQMYRQDFLDDDSFSQEAAIKDSHTSDVSDVDVVKKVVG
ncbi:MAG: Mov34/MPN/PAD-1 family protein, partial [Planctomycetota bacterium]